jgi:hypothetical protein
VRERPRGLLYFLRYTTWLALSLSAQRGAELAVSSVRRAVPSRTPLPVPLQRSSLPHGSRDVFLSKHEIDQNQEFGVAKKERVVVDRCLRLVVGHDCWEVDCAWDS